MSRGTAVGTGAVALSVALPAAAHEGMAHGQWWPLGGGHAVSIPFIGLALLVGLLALAFAAGRRARGRDAADERRPETSDGNPLRELELRFARGEIDEEELERRRRVLER